MQSLKVSDVMWNHIEPIRRGTPLTKVVKTLLHNHVTGLPGVDAVLFGNKPDHLAVVIHDRQPSDVVVKQCFDPFG